MNQRLDPLAYVNEETYTLSRLRQASQVQDVDFSFSLCYQGSLKTKADAILSYFVSKSNQTLVVTITRHSVIVHSIEGLVVMQKDYDFTITAVCQGNYDRCYIVLQYQYILCVSVFEDLNESVLLSSG